MLATALAISALLSQVRGTEPTNAAEQRAKWYRTSHALIVGIDPYSGGFRDLSYAEADAREISSLLTGSYGFPDSNVKLVLGKDATLSGIKREISKLTNPEKVKEEDQVLIYFAGHGHTLSIPGGGEMGFLIPYSAKIEPGDLRNPQVLNDEALSMEDLWRLVRGIAARHVLIVADACFSGLIGQTRNSESPKESTIQDLLLRRTRVIITGGTRDQVTNESPSVGHGLFTAKLLEELRIRAATAPGAVFGTDDIFAKLSTAVSNAAPASAPQRPQRKLDGDGDILFRPESKPPKTEISGGAASPKPKPEAAPTAIGLRKRSAKGQIDLVLIPAGEFEMGSNDIDLGRPRFGDRAEQPVRRVKLDSYWIGITPVTVAQFRLYTSDPKGYAADFKAAFDWAGWEPVGNWIDNHPIHNITWDEARAFCRWAGGDLPTEAQWERAARGDSGFRYPWGNEWDPTRLYWGGSKPRLGMTTAPVGSFPAGASPFGCLDMAGNISQFCLDPASGYDPAALVNPIGKKSPNGEDAFIHRGGNYDTQADNLTVFRSANRAPVLRKARGAIGFRLCVPFE